MNLGDLLKDSTDTAPALVDESVPDSPRAWTASQLHRAANAFARGLVSRGYRRGDRIAIATENRAEFLSAYFGILRAGMVAVPVNVRLSQAGLVHIIDDADVRLAVVDRRRRDLLAGRVPMTDADAQDASGWDAFLDPGEFSSIEPKPGQLAKIMYTSGSTGTPKGVPLTHEGMLWAMSKYVDPAEGPSDDRTIISAPMYHMNGLVFAQLALAARMPFVLQAGFDARRFLDAIVEHRVTVLSGIPTMFALMARELERGLHCDLSRVRLVTVGSAPMTSALYARLAQMFPNAQVNNGYGLTEAGPAIFGPHPRGLARPPMSIGHPFADVQWQLVGGRSDAEGTLIVRTPANMSGYLNLPHATAQRMQDGWFNTGDVLRRDQDGFFYFVGRADDMFVCGGENVYPGEVEKLLETHPAVAQACVVPAADDIKGHIPVAFVVLRAPVTADDIRSFSLAQGPAFSHPRIVVIKREMPVGATHKIDRRALQDEAMCLARSAGRYSGQ